MTRTSGWILLILLLLSGASAWGQSEHMLAPATEELDRRSNEWISSRRWMALLILGGTFAAGAGASMVRRRKRRRERETALAGSPPAWPSVAEILALDPPLRMDRLRKALRAGLAPGDNERPALEQLFGSEDQPAMRVLVLEALATRGGAPTAELLEAARQDPADSVRSAALQLILESAPARAEELARAHLRDPAVEVRALAADLLVERDPQAAGEAMLDLVRAEALGPRESHALRRAMGFFAEELRDPAWAARIAALRTEVEDSEGMIDWALAELASRRN